MDSNNTVLNTIKQEVNSVKGSVVEMNNIIDEFQIKGIRKAVELRNYITTTNNLNLLSLKGKGKLIGLYWEPTRNIASTQIKKLSITKDGAKYDIYLGRDLQSIKFVWLARHFVAARNNYYITTGLTSKDEIADLDIFQPDGFYLINGFPDTIGSSKIEECYLSDTGLSFDSSLQIDQEMSGSNKVSVYFTAIYIIE